MTTTDYTGGEWETRPMPADEEGDTQIGIWKSDAGDTKPIAVAVIKGKNKFDKETEANARLITAAPKLLASLKLAHKFLDSLPEGWLGKTTGDVGALNDFYIQSGRAMKAVEVTSK